ncbi:hypothetical protein M413DRAFT_30729 [Hebeloma cylindrosporum]|uniref:F-box domain-containing protein n=1 Tax=Hebeloma cylindrosporum TaxID=76867 RepID=A0A0C3C2G8_HEBCY|nr:hypothetical protein M413DRAFT_30729 [Hebeloma cylindrosporum h7]
MERRTTLPLDILVSIIDLLAGGDNENFKSLGILSQTCKSMVPLCRKHLFSSLRLRSSSKSKPAEFFSDLLSQNPDIAHYVRSLDYAVYNPIGDHELNILDILKERSSLQTIKLLSPPGFDWNDFPESIRSSLFFLIQQPTVTRLDIAAFKGFPATALSYCSNLIDLQLSDGVEIAPSEVNHDQAISRILLNSARLHADGPFIDFSRLEKAFFDVDSPGNIGHINDLIKATTRLEYFYIDMDWPVSLGGLGPSLAINAYRTLKFLQLSIDVVGDDYDPLCGLNHELRFISGNNVLENIVLDIVVQVDASCRTESDDWSAFDSVLKKTGAFPMLHRVSVEIWWLMYCMGVDDDEDRISESLKEDKFPRLVKSKAVEFNFSALIYSGWCRTWFIVKLSTTQNNPTGAFHPHHDIPLLAAAKELQRIDLMSNLRPRGLGISVWE